jgi:glycosyltransferase involved in cell wall biosynthesis
MTAHSDLSIVAIIPLYNGAKWIEQAVTSVLAQTRQPDEFIVVDDGSTDNGAGAAIVERMAQEHPIIRLLCKPNGGQSSARNFGVAHSKSALIALLDQDDAWYPHHLETLIKPFLEPQAMQLGWVYSNIDLVTENGEMFCYDYLNDLKVEHPKRHLARCFKEDMHILPSASLMLRQAFESIGGFDERLSGYEDDDLFLRMYCAHWRNAYLPDSLSFWRMNNSSASYSPRMPKSRMIYARKLLAQFPDDRQRRMYFSRDYIAPKFFRLSAADFSHAVSDRNREVAMRALDDLSEIAPHLHPRIRLLFWLAMPLLRSLFLARILIGAGNLARGVLAPAH